MRRLRFVVAAVLLLGGVLLTVYGLFAVLYHGDGGPDTYISIAGRDLDADLVGTVAIVVAR